MPEEAAVNAVPQSLSKSIENLFERGQDLNERIVCDETSIHNMQIDLDKKKEDLAILESQMWLTICEKKDASQKPVYTNDQTRKAAYAELISRCQGKSSDAAPEKFKDYAPLVARVRELEHDLAMHEISVSALRRGFNLVCATLNAKFSE